MSLLEKEKFTSLTPRCVWEFLCRGEARAPGQWEHRAQEKGPSATRSLVIMSMVP